MINNITIIGRLTDKPVINEKETVNAFFKIAVNGGKDKTFFFPVLAFRELAERVGKYLTKGSLVCVSGYLSQRKFTNRDNVTKEVIEIIANNIEFLTPKKEQEEPKEETLEDKKSVTAQEIYDGLDIPDDELPF